ncbi:hypothetical protein SELMODRAFT_447844 [Selaginella moellendorffii]|uniref:Methyltransferase type 12 domain-containing protein n=1 Tax=Selaginella moellendorffii TaxID=88036 RepID=D8T2Q8_SELML|nr:uncharacterized protein LOC9629345 isoform X1 [Selaginella moellendorffii]EFJ09092.1 hypothetical protein SELMODRAFT_447844 [Selaginella moellendorffii]|eukprot:XP_002989825.1 uncharacterized protein LOC9629345 isoform X1 [Selaginella moellendorffii]
MQIYPTKSQLVSAFWRDKYEREAMRYWDKFYKRNENRFFKDRHYLDKEWGNYFTNLNSSRTPNASSAGVVLEVGCGVGNTIFPLLAEYPHIFVHGCDFSPRAIEIVKAHSDYTDSRANAFVCDVTSEQLTEHMPSSSADIVTLVFMLSAVSPDRMSGVLANIKRVLKPGGHVLFRDYAVGDLSEERFRKKDQQISENFFVRGDGTRAFYFSEDFLSELFMKEGFAVEALDVVCKVVENRSKGLAMDRKWIQGAFVLKEELGEDASCSLDGLGEDLFIEAPVPEETAVELGDYRIVAKSISRSHQHTCKSTGLMLWESALAMSQLLLRFPSLLRNKTVLELGSGCVGICSLLASLSASHVLTTDADTQALDLLQQNIQANAQTFPVDKISCQRLQWGDCGEISSVLGRFSGGFEFIFGTDVTYVEEALPALFETAKQLLSSAASSKPSLLLCHLTRRIDEAQITSSATRHGFLLKRWWLSTDQSLAVEELGIDEGFHAGTSYVSSPVMFLWYSYNSQENEFLH